MIYRRFGRTELSMPGLTCGGMRYQQTWADKGPEDITPENQENLEKTIHRAIELGINHIETARGYGTSELQLGSVLPLLPRDKIIVQTKVAPTEKQEDFFSNFEKSMKNLHLDSVDLFSIHGINTPQLMEWTLRKGGTLDAARKLQKEGRVRFIGFSTHAELDTILDGVRSNEFDYVNLHWYYVNQLNWPAIVEARQRDMGVFIISPNDKGGKLYTPSEKLRSLCAPLSPMIFNDLFCLSRPEVHTLSIGAAKPTDFDEHIRALEWIDKSQEILPTIISRLDAEVEKVVGPLWPINWSQGIPDSSDAPGTINIREITRLWMMERAFGLETFAKERYNLFGEGGHWFPGSKATEFDEKEILACVEKNPLRDRIPGILRDAHARFSDVQKKRLSQGD